MNRFSTLVLVPLLTLAASVSAADLLTFTDGRTLAGEYIGGGRASVSFRVGSHVERIGLERIRSLRFDPLREPHAETLPGASSNARIVATGDGTRVLRIQPLPAPATTAN